MNQMWTKFVKQLTRVLLNAIKYSQVGKEEFLIKKGDGL
jgi:hypothetical protein